MASRRKYKPPRGFKEGGAVKADDVAPMPEVGADVPPAPATLVTAEKDDPVKRALDASRRADELQREAAQRQAPQQPQTIDQFIDHLAVPEERKQWFRAHPQVFAHENTSAVRFYQQQAQEAGIAPGRDEDEFIWNGVRDVMEQRRQRQIEAMREATRATPPMPVPTVEHSARRLEGEAAVHRAVESAETPEPVHVDATAPPPSPQRRSMPVSAPVSREVPSANGQRANPRSITLSLEERDVARRSYHWLSADQAEHLYMTKKMQLGAMRQRGEYPESERN